MILLDYSLPSPEENLALDEALLIQSETQSGTHRELLRFWESPTYFVVVGVAGKIDQEIHREACERDQIPFFRRASGGGTVLQGPGCINYSLVLDLEKREGLYDVTKGYRAILDRLIDGLNVPGLEREGISDLTLNHIKFSGCAQKRKRRTLLHHGTILYNFDLDKISIYQQEPLKQPDYRQQRSHSEFVCNLELPLSQIKSSIAGAWNAIVSNEEFDYPEVESLIEEKYSRREWNEKF